MDHIGRGQEPRFQWHPGFVGPGGTFDSVITLNTGITFPPQANNGSNYGLQAVANHEIDEALGIGGAGSQIGSTFTPSGAGDTDLYRYSAAGVRSFTTDPNATAYFSIDGGVTNLTNFNQAGGGSDYGDWKGGGTPQVQDAFGTPGANPALGVNELTALNVIGYQLNAQATPEPATFTLLGGIGLALSGCGWLRRKQRAK